MQSVLRTIFPPQCVTCRKLVESEFALCGACWRDTTFISGLICDKCGVPLPGSAGPEMVHCDDCITVARPWDKGRAAMLYKENSRKIVLALKHGDREDLVRPAAGWMLRAGASLIKPNMLVAPVPLHWSRLLKRRYNQAALLGKTISKQANLEFCPDLLRRTSRTAPLDGLTRDERFQALTDVIRPNPKRHEMFENRPVLLIDDVMTSGATLAACTEACFSAGAVEVFVLILARVAKDA
ncbi:ComF family protein [Pseudohalocynthiibacter aestuariivivens]|uniref:ComF family protein n=2 Tax=Pseudohalocynthiibacter aestuariivivens TaxID=1591409 RepID=A0ABV5JJV8_9RHOB|nr:ComF family protein [Pseudohalocynthiibacter sp. F2068]MBS9717622.1 ComF family protein [Pseudohalocynthiibacter aestuariivivens]